MIITFFGHSNCLFNDDIKKQLKNILLDEIIKNPTCKFYLGGYGDFDGLCLRTLKDLKADFPEIELIFITPYLDKNYSWSSLNIIMTTLYSLLLKVFHVSLQS